MPQYAFPGVSITPRRARITGATALFVTGAMVAALHHQATVTAPPQVQVTVRTDQIGEGIATGTAVRLDGVTVGAVTDIETQDNGQQLLRLDLDPGQIAGLTDTFTVSYAPQNLFGISTVALRQSTGGAPLRSGAVIDRIGTTDNTTMSALLRLLTDTSTNVLTPKLADVLRQLGADIRAFTPLIQAVVTLGRAIADTQQYPSSYLLSQYGQFIGGIGTFAGSTFELANGIEQIEIFKTDRARYNAFIQVVTGEIFPGIGDISGAAHTHFSGYAQILTPLLTAVANTVRDPERSRAELTELLDRLTRAFADTANGPALEVEVALRAVPGVAIPLLGGTPR